MKNSRYRYLYGTGTRYKSSKFLNSWRRKSVPVPNFSDTGSETFSGTIFFRYRFRDFFRYRFRYHQKNEKIPVALHPIPSTYITMCYIRLWRVIFFERSNSVRIFLVEVVEKMNFLEFGNKLPGCIFPMCIFGKQIFTPVFPKLLHRPHYL